MDWRWNGSLSDTDVVLVDEETGEVRSFKEETTPADFAKGVVIGLRKLLSREGVAPGSVGFVAHGTTVATNAVIERTGYSTGS